MIEMYFYIEFGDNVPSTPELGWSIHVHRLSPDARKPTYQENLLPARAYIISSIPCYLRPTIHIGV